MSMLLFIIGGIAVMVGAATVAFGIPINEFSFGNTLIVSGTTVGTGGLIIIALAAAVARLNRIAEALAARPEAFPHEALEPPPETSGLPAPGRIPFPPRKRPVEPAPAELPGFEPAPAAESAGAEPPAPSLRNPEAPPTLAEEVSLSPNGGQPRPLPPDFAPPAHPALPPAGEPAFEMPWRTREPSAAEPSSGFDAMWPEPAKPPEPEPAPEPPAAAPPPARAVAVLKAGVVDGMGYTLYVDGSIEAELPQGTLRFASIDELREHLEKGA